MLLWQLSCSAGIALSYLSRTGNYSLHGNGGVIFWLSVRDSDPFFALAALALPRNLYISESSRLILR